MYEIIKLIGRGYPLVNSQGKRRRVSGQEQGRQLSAGDKEAENP